MDHAVVPPELVPFQYVRRCRRWKKGGGFDDNLCRFDKQPQFTRCR